MQGGKLDLPTEPAAALATLRERSQHRPVVVFKRSPTCPISFHAEAEFEAWLEQDHAGLQFDYAVIDVIAQRALARGLTKELGIAHESPQALWFRDGECTWHDSHSSLTREQFSAQLGAA